MKQEHVQESQLLVLLSKSIFSRLLRLLFIMGTPINCRESRFYRDTRRTEPRWIGINFQTGVLTCRDQRNNQGALIRGTLMYGRTPVLVSSTSSKHLPGLLFYQLFQFKFEQVNKEC